MSTSGTLFVQPEKEFVRLWLKVPRISMWWAVISKSKLLSLLSWESRTVAVTSWYNFGERCLRYVVRRNSVTGLQRCNHITKSFILYCTQTAQIETSTDCAGFVARVKVAGSFKVSIWCYVAMVLVNLCYLSIWLWRCRFYRLRSSCQSLYCLVLS